MDPTTDLCVSIGDVVADKYRVDGIIGVGGMAFVVVAWHAELEQRFALKFLSTSFAERPEFVERFTREAKASCRLRSEHIARVHDVGMHRGTPFLVMEHLTGRDLATVLAESGPLSIEDAVEHAIQACEALATAHNHGIIHRDVKPENLFRVEEDGLPHVKLLDFGISKIEGPVSRCTGELSMGTPTYMAPEQIRSTASADARSDQWSLGVVLYELLAGAPPFAAESVSELCAAVLERTPARLDEIHPDIPRGLADVIERCMHRDPDQRHRDVAALAEALLPYAPARAVVSAERAARILSGVASGGLSRSTPPAVTVTPSVDSRTVPPEPRRSRMVPLSMVGGVALLAAALALVSTRATSATDEPATARASEPPPTVATAMPTETAVAVDAVRIANAGTGAAKPVAAPTAAVARRPASSARGAASAPSAAGASTTSSATASASANAVANASANATNAKPIVELGY